ncbi:MAG: Uma2 family endonuclease [Lachnospiraceae bacterium]|nr:Uma2 family endonuclease [Lachnospiraceae bacterium]
MPALQPQLEIITLDQYEALPEDKRVEVFEGVVYDMASPSQIHQSISMQLSTIINNYLLQKKGPCRIFSAPFDVKLSDKPLTIVQPDIMSVIKISWTRIGAMVLQISLLKSFLLGIRQMTISASSTITRIMEYVNIGL